MKIHCLLLKKHKLILFLIAGAILTFSCQVDKGENNLSLQDIDLLDKEIPNDIDFNFHVKPILADRCFKCHGPDKNKIEAGLSFFTFESATTSLGEEKDRYAIVPYNTKESVLVAKINAIDPGEMMPPPESNLSLNAYEKKILTKWIEQGAEYKIQWSLLPIANIPPIADYDLEWVNNDIDRYILDRLGNSGLKPSPTAKKEYLIRRLSFALTGLPPSLSEIERYLSDESDLAYDLLIDLYLKKSSYGEHMASYWMDLARYADTHGYQDDLERIMWPWRDWVISAYNRNLPFDDFVTYQLAGDLLPNVTREQIIATAFNRNHSITQEGGVIPEEYRTEYVADRTMTFGKAFLGMTVECARCHDHKYDPISQKDYYSLFSFFNNIPEKGLIEQYGAIPEPYIEITKEEVDSVLTFINNLDSLEKIPLLVMEEMEKPRPTFVLERGLYNKPTIAVDANVPESILSFDTYPKNRLGLSQWLFDKQNPLTARVAVNRLWQMCFGKGLVTTSDDFGVQGALPSHPELLDHLAFKFIAEGWNVKSMLKYILSSRTYQQSSISTNFALIQDPDNLFYARAPRLRLSAESIRDNALFASGLLVETIGGPSVKPYQPKGLWKEKTGGGGGSTAEYVVDEDSKKYRRSLYTFWKRTVPPPSMMTFDAVSRDFCIVNRETTSTPLQALVMMNNPEIIQASMFLARNSLDAFASVEERIENMFEIVTSRKPKQKEVKQLSRYLIEQKAYFQHNKKIARAYLSNIELNEEENEIDTELAAYTMLATVIFNLDESLTRS